MTVVGSFSANPFHRAQPEYFTRDEATTYLQTLGLPIGAKQLSQLAWRGDGPHFFKFGRHCMYRLDDLISWVAERAEAKQDFNSRSGKALKAERQALFGDPERAKAYSAALSQGQRSSWSDPEQRAARMVKLRATRARNRAEKDRADETAE